MRVAVVNLTGGSFSGGYLKYLRELIPRLRQQPGISSLVMLSPAGSLPPRPDFADTMLEWPRHDRWSGFQALRAHIDSFTPDVLFFPTARLVRTTIPTTVMVRNMEPLVAPRAGHTPAVAAANTARRLVARAACRRAQRVIAVSQYVRDYLVERWHIDPARVGIVYHGVADSSPERARRPASLPPAIGRPWLFTAGSLRPARGLSDAIDALAALRRDGLELPLVIAGAPDPDCEAYLPRLRRRAQSLGVSDLLIWAGRLSAAELQWCLASCDLFLMTSRAEACPNIALEAMSAGAASIAADNPPLPEFFQQSARYYPPRSGRTLAAQIAGLLQAPTAERERLRTHARARAAEFTWEATAANTAAELLYCASQPRVTT